MVIRFVRKSLIFMEHLSGYSLNFSEYNCLQIRETTLSGIHKVWKKQKENHVSNIYDWKKLQKSKLVYFQVIPVGSNTFLPSLCPCFGIFLSPLSEWYLDPVLWASVYAASDEIWFLSCTFFSSGNRKKLQEARPGEQIRCSMTVICLWVHKMLH